jgi:hypothetical protein
VSIELGAEPAHPISCLPGSIWTRTGLSKREYFAAMAMQGLLGDQRYWESLHEHEARAAAAVAQADALLKELAK